MTCVVVACHAMSQSARLVLCLVHARVRARARARALSLALCCVPCTLGNTMNSSRGIISMGFCLDLQSRHTHGHTQQHAHHTTHNTRTRMRVASMRVALDIGCVVAREVRAMLCSALARFMFLSVLEMLLVSYLFLQMLFLVQQRLQLQRHTIERRTLLHTHRTASTQSTGAQPRAASTAHTNSAVAVAERSGCTGRRERACFVALVHLL